MIKSPSIFHVPILETERTIMRPPCATDFEPSAAMWSEEAVVKHITGKPSTRSESWTRLLRYIGHWQIMGFGYWIVEDKRTGAFIGEVGLAENRRDVSPSIEGCPEIGWVICPQAQGKGFATEAALAVVNWADRNLASSTTVCLFDPKHSASMRVAEKAGYLNPSPCLFDGSAALVMRRARKSR